ncbi:MAG: hypothetical protein V3U24_01545 [Candidatus Neomarinimicrobiota bacterium]
MWGTVSDALNFYKRSPGNESGSRRAVGTAVLKERIPEKVDPNNLPFVSISRPLADSLEVKEGDLLYLSDRRWWLGGLKSTHALSGGIVEDYTEPAVEMGENSYQLVISPKRRKYRIIIEKLY